MSRRTIQQAVAAVAGAAFLVLAAAARQPAAGPDPAGGKFVLPDGDSVVVSIDDFGRLEGYAERNGEFRRLTGLYADGAATGYWVSRRGGALCETEREGSRSWGRFRLNWDAAGQPRAAWSACEAPPVER